MTVLCEYSQGNKSMDLHGRRLDLANSYTGHEWDGTLGVYYAKARFYQPSVGRFLAEDTHWGARNRIYGDNPRNRVLPDIHAIRQSGNLYAYVMGNPLYFFDPNGEDSWVIYAEGNNNEETENVREAARREAERLEKEYGTPAHVIGVSSAAAFSNVWNNVIGYNVIDERGRREKIDIDAVFILSHGGFIRYGDNSIGVLAFGPADRRTYFHAVYSMRYAK